MKRSHERELMDLPGQPQRLLEEDLRNLRVINRYLGGYRGALITLERLVEKHKIHHFSLLDIGTGSGDIPARITRWAYGKGIRAEIVALEPEAVTARVAATLTNPPFPPRSCEKICSWFDRLTTSGREQWNFRYLAAGPEPVEGQRLIFSQLPLSQRGKEGDFRRPGILVVRGDGLAPPFRAGSFDFVLASQLLHHFSEEQIVAMLRTWSHIARKAVIVSDLIRHPLAYYGIRVITRLFTRNIMTLTDGPLSVRRAFTLAEWRELFRSADIGPFQIFSLFPFRVAALISLRTDDATN